MEQENILQDEPQPLLSLSGLNDQILNEQPDENLQASIVLSKSKLFASQGSNQHRSTQQSPKRNIQTSQIQNSAKDLLTKQFKKLNLSMNAHNLEQIKQKLEFQIYTIENKYSLPQDKNWKQIFNINKGNQLSLSSLEKIKGAIETLQQSIQSDLKSQNQLQISFTQNTLENIQVLIQCLIDVKNSLQLLPNNKLVDQNADLIVKFINQWRILIQFLDIKIKISQGPIKQINMILDTLCQQFNIKLQVEDEQNIEDNQKHNIQEIQSQFQQSLQKFILISQQFISQVNINQSFQNQKDFCLKCINLL